MKKCFLCFLPFAFLTLARQSQRDGTGLSLRASTDQPIKKVVVKAVNFNSETYSGISCDAFDRQFPEATITLIVDHNTLAALTQRIALFKKGDQDYQMDTRAKAIIYYTDGTTATICIDRFSMHFNGKRISYNKEIGRLLLLKPGF